MTIKYKVGRAMLGGEERLYPRLVVGEKTSGEDFQRKVAQRAARGLADVAAVFIAAREILLEELRDDQAVQVPGFGIFTASLKGDLDDDQRLVTQSARLRINYRPDRDLTEDANADLSFEYVGD
jgi:hypothetical protein